MEQYPSKSSFLEARKRIDSHLSIGFVPTMGALQQGHASLVQQSVKENDLTVVSIFVNPTQFGPGEDLDSYPRTLENDSKLLESLGVDMLFVPSAKQIYGKESSQIIFSLKDIDRKLCGAKRPGHFNGVIQVVSILFNIVQPTKAYFGSKDYQQSLIIRKLIEELHFPVSMVNCPIIREKDGLAMSSRNAYLRPSEREQAICLHRTMTQIKGRMGDFRTVNEVRAFVEEEMQKYPLASLDYFEILNDDTLKEETVLSSEGNPRAFMAAYVGKTRLIDNMSLM